MNLSLTSARRVMLIVSSCIAVNSFDACATANMHGTADDYQALLASGNVGVVMLGRDACPHCVHAGPVFEEIAMSPDYENVTFIKLDSTDHPEIMEEYKIDGVPAFLFIRGGKVVNQETGFDKTMFDANLKSHVSGSASMDTQVDAMAPVHESHEEEGVLAKLTMLFVGLFEIIKNIFVTIFDWIMGLFGR